MNHLPETPPSPAVIDPHLQTARECLASGRYAEAKNHLLAIITLTPDHPEANYALGLLAVATNHPGEGLAFFEKALDKSPENGAYWLGYIDALDRSGQPDLARQILSLARQSGLEGEKADALAARLGNDASPHEPVGSEPSPPIPLKEVPEGTTVAGPLEDADDRLLQYYRQGDYTACEHLAHALLQQEPDRGFAWKILGAVLQQQNRPAEAVAAMRESARLLPADPESWNNLGLTLKNTDDLVESEACLRRALALNSEFAEAYNNLGVTLMAQGRLREAEEAFLQALRLRPDWAEAHCNLGIDLNYQGRAAESETHLQQALQLNPCSAEACNNLGNLLQGTGRLAEAEAYLRKALELRPDFAVAFNNLGNTLHCRGNLQEAEACYLAALRIKPDYAEAYDGLLFVTNYHPDRGEDEIFQRYREYDAAFGIPFRKRWREHATPRTHSRRLKIGYVSPSFFNHPVLHFLEPLLAHHDRSRFELFAYAEVLREDAATERLRTLFDHWLSTVGLPDDLLAKRIRTDGIDILIDLAGHTGRNRLGVFARKPAPVSLHWLDFGYTTGLTAIDYYLTDIQTAPIGSENRFSEQVWRLPRPALVYRPAAGMGAAGPLPAAQHGHVTFGTLTRAIRINHRTIRVWAEILKQTADSRLVIDSGNFKDPAVRETLAAQFRAHGIDADRLDIGYHSPPWDVLRAIDISFDCFPHNSGTTLFESLYLGVPFITLAERTGVGRLGCSILEAVGHPEWVATTETEYIEKAVALAADLPRLAAIRNNLRAEMQNGPLMDERGFTGAVEEAFLRMFRRWCRELPRSKGKGIASALPAATPPEEDEAVSLFNRGVEEQQQERLSEAESLYLQALNIRPDFVIAYNNLGVIANRKARYGDAKACFTQALAVKPDFAEAYLNLANTAKLQEAPLQAEGYYRKAIALLPDSADAHYHLGNILQETGRPDEAEVHLRQALTLRPDHVNTFSTLLFALNYHPDKAAETIFQAYRDFDARFGLPHRKCWQPHPNTRNGDRRLKVGYVAPDYRRHPARYFLEPLLTHHDKGKFTVFAYVELSAADAPTDIFTACADHWRACAGMTDDQLARKIRDDGIDILVDLAGHTAGNRLGVFARKPAPVSLHWLDFGYTTGLSAIDYYLTDRATVPAGSESIFSETPWRLEPPALAYRPPAGMGPVNDLPALTNGFTTFGTLTRAARINYRTIRTWAQILKRCPEARLMVNSGSYREPAMQELLADQFVACGIARTRLDIGSESPPWNLLRRMDIGLDCFPHNSGTTLIESLYLGVPFITLADRPSVGRLGSSILKGLGHPEWIAETEEDYIDKAAVLAADTHGLAAIRNNLRTEMETSPLMDEQGFAARVEAAYRDMFDRWCASERTVSAGGLTPSAPPASAAGKKRTARRQKAAPSAGPSATEMDRLARLYQQGETTKAAELAAALTRRFPDHGFGWKLLGPLLYRQGRTAEAIEAMVQATVRLPADPEAFYNLGVAQEQSGDPASAVRTYRTVISLAENHLQAHFNLGNSLTAIGCPEEAETVYRRLLRLKPDFFEASCNLGAVLKAQHRLVEAADCYRSALAIKADSGAVLTNLGVTLKELGRLDEAERICEKALAVQPDLPEAIVNMGIIRQEEGRLDEAEALYRRALELQPDSAVAVHNLCLLSQKQHRLTAAERLCSRALLAHPENALLHQDMGLIRIGQGRLAEAEADLRRAIALRPDSAQAYGNLLFLLNNHPDKTAAAIYEDYRQFDQRFGIPLQREWRPAPAPGFAQRRLRVGYVAYHLRAHSIRHFLEPLLAAHDREQFEIFAYTDLVTEDKVTARYRSVVEHWVQTTGLSDAALTDRIRADGIDILVDLAGHTEGNRLGVFARKPCPVSLHWLDFGYTTGLSAIDYYLTDIVTVPEGSESLFAETPWRLATPGLVYRPAEGMGEVGPLPALERGHVTFGTLSRALRINHRTIRVWSEILKRVPDSRLVVDSGDYRDPDIQVDLINRFAACGIAPERLAIGFHSPPWDTLRNLDIGLDCFPHNSGTTLFETLYMGVPFVTLADRPCVGRLGSSILTGLGHPEWIAESEEDYINKAAALAADTTGLAAIRNTLRTEMENGPLMDEPGFAAKVEGAYRQMVERWRQRTGAAAPATQETAAAETIERALQQALTCRQSGLLDQAEALLLSILTIRPDHPQANVHLGLLVLEKGQAAAALPYLETAVAAHPEHGPYWLAYIDALDRAGQSATASDLLEKAVQAGLAGEEVEALNARLQANAATVPAAQDDAVPTGVAPSLSPDSAQDEAQAQYRLANALAERGNFAEAEAHYHKAIAADPEHAEALCNLGNLLQRRGATAAAEQSFRRAIAVRPDFAEVHFNLGNLLRDTGRLDEARECYQLAIARKTNYAKAHSNLGITLQMQGALKEAERSYRKALSLQPGFFDGHINLGACLKEQGRYTEAEKHYRKALKLQPGSDLCLSNLGSVLKEQGRLAEAEDCLRRALAINPNAIETYSNLLFLLNYHPDRSAEEIYAEYARFNARFAAPLATRQPHANSRRPDRRLKIGYVSPQFRRHSLRHFLEPLLAHHDKRQFEIFAYAEVASEDELSHRYRAVVDHWRTTTGIDDGRLAETIRADEIDILVDLAGHTAHNRLRVFAMRPAPVSLHWLDFGYTTGLTAIDYYLTDRATVPEGYENVFAETPWRMEPPCLVYRPAEGMGAVNVLPAIACGHITFGTLTRAVRINHRTIRVWAEILRRVPGSHLRIDSSNFREQAMRKGLERQFAAWGIAKTRLEIGFTSPPWDVLRAFDIGLDCFPHNSGTTLFETLYMGVPFITLAGRPSVGRLGASILMGLGHPEWIAASEEEYIERAVSLAADPARLARLRAGLRQEMEGSLLMDEPGFARRVEAAYKQMFFTWCKERQ